MQLESILLQEGQQGGGMSFLLMMGLIFVVFYFFMIRPQQKRQKTEARFRDSLQKGDKVTTIGGIYGKVVSIDEGNTVLVEVDNGVKLKIEKVALRPVVETDGSSK